MLLSLKKVLSAYQVFKGIHKANRCRILRREELTSERDTN